MNLNYSGDPFLRLVFVINIRRNVQIFLSLITQWARSGWVWCPGEKGREAECERKTRQVTDSLLRPFLVLLLSRQVFLYVPRSPEDFFFDPARLSFFGAAADRKKKFSTVQVYSNEMQKAGDSTSRKTKNFASFFGEFLTAFLCPESSA
jgi:hypothetical protein